MVGIVYMVSTTSTDEIILDQHLGTELERGIWFFVILGSGSASTLFHPRAPVGAIYQAHGEQLRDGDTGTAVMRRIRVTKKMGKLRASERTDDRHVRRTDERAGSCFDVE